MTCIRITCSIDHALTCDINPLSSWFTIYICDAVGDFAKTLAVIDIAVVTMFQPKDIHISQSYEMLLHYICILSFISRLMLLQFSSLQQSINHVLILRKLKRLCCANLGPDLITCHCHDVDRVASAKLLGVIFQDNFKMDMHVNFVLSQCNRRLCVLKLLRSQSLSTVQLDQVSQAIIVSRLRYALPACLVGILDSLSN